MKLKLIIASAAFICTSCNIPENEIDSVGIGKTDALVEIVEHLENETINNEVVFIANGSEPGWSANFFNNKAELLLNYGKDTLILDLVDFSSFLSKNSFDSPFKASVKGNSDVVAILLEKSQCKQESTGDAKNFKVTIEFGKEKYLGCGNEIK